MIYYPTTQWIFRKNISSRQCACNKIVQEFDGR